MKPPPFVEDEELPADLKPADKGKKKWSGDDKGCIIMVVLYKLVDVDQEYDSARGVPTEVAKRLCLNSPYTAAYKFEDEEIEAHHRCMIVNNGWDGRKTLIKNGLVSETWGKSDKGFRGKVFKLTTEGTLVVREWQRAGLVEF